MLEKLQQIGLSETESKIYVALVHLGTATANQLAKQTSKNRTVTYNILQQLVEKGVITYIQKDNKRFFSIADPHSLLAKIHEKEHIAQSLIEDIKRVKTNVESSKGVEVYEGLQGMKVLHNEFRHTKELAILNATGLIFDHLKYSAGHIIKDIVSIQNCRMIANQSSKKTKLSEFNFNIKFLPKSAENYATTFIFDNKVIIQVLKDKPFLIKIENREIFDGYKKDFDLLWKKL
jgi:sugar-specific transcriptional regulator TrmB